MSSCYTGNGHGSDTGRCPQSGFAGVAVERQTVKALLTQHALARLEAGNYRFCADACCDIVCFSDTGSHLGTLKVTGMICAGCEAAVRVAARSVEGVTELRVHYAKGNAEVTFDRSKTTPAAIAKVIIDKSGSTAEPVTPSTKK